MHERKALQQKTLAQQLDDHREAAATIWKATAHAACRTKYSGTLRKGTADERRVGGAQPRQACKHQRVVRESGQRA